MEPLSAKLVPYLERIAEGDHAAFSALYQATSPKLYGIIKRIIKQKELSEEVLQEAYVKIWQQAHRYDHVRASPIAWLSVIARNCAIDEVRKRSLPPAPEDAIVREAADDRSNPVRQADTNEQLRKLMHCLEGLDAGSAGSHQTGIS